MHTLKTALLFSYATGCFLLIQSFLSSASAQGIVAMADEGSSTPPGQVIEIEISPAEQPVPALKYHLLPSSVLRRPGNSVVWYGKIAAEQTPFFNQWYENADNVKLLKMPLKDLLGSEDARKFSVDSSIFQFLERAARSEFTDWQLPIREGSTYLILLPEIQRQRTFATLLALRARWQIANGQYDEAVETIQTGISMGQQVAQADFYVCSLVGNGCYRMMAEQLLTFCQQPDSPSLYWALSSLPQPLIPISDSHDLEYSVVDLSFPELANLDSNEFGADYWNQVFAKVLRELKNLNFDDEPAFYSRDLPLPLVTAKYYLSAKQMLQKYGYTEDEIEAMPPAQAILKSQYMGFDVERSRAFQYLNLPSEEIRRFRERQAVANPEGSDETRPIPSGLMFAQVFLPASEAVRDAQLRVQQNIAMLRIIEALRIHAGDNAGMLPETLQEISAVPIPNDPFTDASFNYQLQDDRAILIPAASNRNLEKAYEIRIRKE